MSIERVQATLRNALGSSQKPTQAEVLDISGLTYIEEARQEIQRMVERRLRHTGPYRSPETYHTLVLIEKCLSTASQEFIDFCTSQVHLVVSLTHYARHTTQADREMSRLICDRASTLSKILLDTARLSEMRSIVLADTASVAGPPRTRMTTVPLPTPPTSPEKFRKPPQTTQLPKRNFLSNLAPIHETFSKLGITNDVKNNTRNPTPAKGGRREKSPPPSILAMKRDDVANMTFKSEGLDGILRALDDHLRVGPSLRKDPDELVKALTLVHHCLYWGSPAFVAHCEDIKTKFDDLLQHPVPQVCGRAQAVVSLLDDTARLQQERQRRVAMMSHNPTSSAKSQEQSAPKIRTSTNDTESNVMLEPVLDLSQHVTKKGSRPVAGGGYSDVWQGIYSTDSGKQTVAIKFLRRLNKVPPERLQKRLNRELHAWRSIMHDRITPFYGIIVDEEGEVGMVSPYYSQGNVLGYVKRNQETDPLQMLQGIAEGVEYLHTQRIVHGDIKGANIMVSDEGAPKLIDFGLAQVIDDFAEVTGNTTSNLASSLRWSAPELLIGDSPVSSKTEKSDVYAFASTCIEIMTLRCPYHGLNDPQVLRRVIKGGIPERPTMEDKWSPCDELWEYLQTCWRKRPHERPNIVAVKNKLSEFYNGSIASAAPPPRQVRFAGWR